MNAIMIVVAALNAAQGSVVAKPASAAPCSGYYVTPRQVDGLSVKVEPTVLEIVYLDYSPHDLARITRNRDGSLTFYVGQGAPSKMRCDANGATVDFPASTTYLHNPEQAIPIPARRVRLVRSTGDIFSYAKKRGWSIGD